MNLKLQILHVTYAEGREPEARIGVAVIEGEKVRVEAPITAQDRDRLMSELKELGKEGKRNK